MFNVTRRMLKCGFVLSLFLSLAHSPANAQDAGKVLLSPSETAQETDQQAKPIPTSNETPSPAAKAEPVKAKPVNVKKTDAGSTAVKAPAQKQIRLSEVKGSRSDSVSVLDRVRSVVGLFALLFICWLMSSHRHIIPWRILLWGVGLQLFLGGRHVKVTPSVWYSDYRWTLF